MLYLVFLLRLSGLSTDIWISLSLLLGIQMATSLLRETRTRLAECGMLETYQNQLLYSKETWVPLDQSVSHPMASLWPWLNQPTLFMCTMCKMGSRKSKRLTFLVRYLESLSARTPNLCSSVCGIVLMVVFFSTTDVETIRISIP